MRDLEQAKRDNLSQVLLKCARLVNERALPRVKLPKGMNAFRQVHTTLFPHISMEGTRITVIAKKIGITKQAVSKLVLELEGMGVVELVPDPQDGRAKLVRWTERGVEGIFVGLEALGSVAKEIEGILGKKRMLEFHRMLLEIHDDFESTS